MKIVRAEHLGMCFGVKDAIALALATAENGPLTILGDLVHNETVLAELESKGIMTKQRPEEVATQLVMVTAHGASERAVNDTRALGLKVLEATCPLVKVAHRAVQNLALAGYHPVIIGLRDHVEVRGLTGDLAECDVALSMDDIDAISSRRRFGVIAQTTQPVEKVRALVERLRARFPDSEVRFIDTVCQPTKQRQNAAVELAQRCDVVVVIGGRSSNNTRELAVTVGHQCARVHHVQSAADLHEDWFLESDIVGVTAGTSTPDSLIDAVASRLEQWAERPELARRPS